jgi:hypothetical protein
MFTLSLLAYMAGKTAATTIRGRIYCVCGFRLPKVTARALFAQQRIGNRIAQGLEALGVRRPGFAIDHLPRTVDNTRSCMHQAALHCVNHARMAGTATLPRIVQVARESDQTRMRECLFRAAGIAGMTARAGCGSKRVPGTEARLLAGVAADTAIAGLLRDTARRPTRRSAKRSLRRNTRSGGRSGAGTGNLSDDCHANKKTIKTHAVRVTDVLGGGIASATQAKPQRGPHIRSVILQTETEAE